MTGKFCNFLNKPNTEKIFSKAFSKRKSNTGKQIVFPKNIFKYFPNTKHLCQNNNNQVLGPNFLGLAMDYQ